MSDQVASTTNDNTMIVPGILQKTALDERLDTIQKTLTEMNQKLDNGPSMAMVTENTSRIAKLDETKLDKKEFEMVRNIVFGMVGIVLMAFAGALVAFVFHGQLPG